MSEAFILRRGGSDSLAGGGGAPEFTYTGEFEILENGKDWCIAFKTSGDFEISKLKGAEGGIDVFICGGGGNGGQSSQGYYAGVSYYGGGGGGGGGYRETFPGILVAENTIYPIAIGGVSGDSSAFGNTKGGGSTGGKDWGVGGVGGAGGSVGGHGQTSYNGTAGEEGAYAFGEADFIVPGFGSGYRFGAGGGGGSGYLSNSTVGNPTNGGASGGGKGGYYSSDYGPAAQAGVANSGGGGGGAGMWTGAGAGGSGIVIIRNAR
ncbi:MAG: hypothetical protein HP001_07575 [Oscillospiraceae bacterium]|nr:hypothetical protein [Oscillospiraceae bacterium]